MLWVNCGHERGNRAPSFIWAITASCFLSRAYPPSEASRQRRCPSRGEAQRCFEGRVSLNAPSGPQTLSLMYLLTIREADILHPLRLTPARASASRTTFGWGIRVRKIQNKNLSVRSGFASLASRVFALPRRSRRMVSFRAYSSPAPQPAKRHIIKPFSIVRCSYCGRRVGVISWSWRVEG